MIFDRYATVVVPFPFADVPVLKRRPAIVVSGKEFNLRNNSTVVAMITTAKASAWPSDVVISDVQTAGLFPNHASCAGASRLFQTTSF